MYSIKKAVEILQKEYPDINANTLRFWEQEGIKPPCNERTKGGHRRYSERDLNEFRLIKEYSLGGHNLRDIRDIYQQHLTKAGRGFGGDQLVASSLRFMRGRRLLSYKIREFAALNPEEQFHPVYTRDSLLQAVGVAPRVEYGLEKLERTGLVSGDPKATKPTYTRNDEIVLRAVKLIPPLAQFAVYVRLIDAVLELADVETTKIGDSLGCEAYILRAFFSASRRKLRRKPEYDWREMRDRLSLKGPLASDYALLAKKKPETYQYIVAMDQQLNGLTELAQKVGIERQIFWWMVLCFGDEKVIEGINEEMLWRGKTEKAQKKK